MITESQKEASRTNGKLSHGPVTPEGKAISSRNSLKFGFFSKEPLLPGESQEDYRRYREMVMESLAPVGGLEESIADDIVVDKWRLKRVSRIEVGVLTATLCEEQAELALRRAKQVDDRPYIQRPCKFQDPDLKAEFEELAQIHKDALEQLNDPENALGRVYLRDARASAALARLHRYESMLKRGVERNVRELRRLQEERKGAVAESKPVAKAAIEKPGIEKPSIAQPAPKLQNEPGKEEAEAQNEVVTSTPAWPVTVVVTRKIQNEPGRREERTVQKPPDHLAA